MISCSRRDDDWARPFRLASVAPTAISQRLEDITPALERSMKGATVTKDTVKQDLKCAAELQKSTLRHRFEQLIAQTGASPKSPDWRNEFDE